MPGDDHQSTIARGAGSRLTAGIVESLRADPRARAILVHGDRAARAGARLARVAPVSAPDGARWALLGREADGAGVLLASYDPHRDAPARDDWASFRESGAHLDADDAELFGASVALGRWLHDSGWCPACGARADVAAAGWSRRCTGCGREIFPRTDPAVIVGVESEDGERILLGANAAWGGRMYSCFAGFVEAGESAEQTIARELAEEGGVEVARVRYVGSQAWPYPRSLMLGYLATAANEDSVRADGEEIVDVRWFTRDEVREGLAGRGPWGLPGRVSIANRLIREWCDAGRAE